MKTFYVIAPNGTIVNSSSAQTKIGAIRNFLKLRGQGPLEAEKCWTPYRREGYQIKEQLHLDLFREIGGDLLC